MSLHPGGKKRSGRLVVHFTQLYERTRMLSADIADDEAFPGALAMAISGAARVVVADTGQMTYLEQPAGLYFLVSQFLKLQGL